MAVRSPVMPLFMIERNFADQLDLSGDDIKLIDDVNADEGVRWLFSFLSADRRRTYCLYEAPSPEAILAAARRNNVPADEIVEVGPAAAELSGRLRDWAGTVSSS
jgi:Nickel responsive protein SCO4226-like